MRKIPAVAAATATTAAATAAQNRTNNHLIILADHAAHTDCDCIRTSNLHRYFAYVCVCVSIVVLNICACVCANQVQFVQQITALMCGGNWRWWPFRRVASIVENSNWCCGMSAQLICLDIAAPSGNYGPTKPNRTKTISSLIRYKIQNRISYRLDFMYSFAIISKFRDFHNPIFVRRE